MFLKYRKPTIAWVVFLLLCGGVVFASFQGKMERYYGISTDGSVATLPAGTTTLGALVLTNTAVSLTSPTVTFSAAGKQLITLNSDENQTAIVLTGGTMNQIVTIRSGAGSNTMQFDDGTSMTIGGNIVLTEAQNDYLTLQCIGVNGDTWAAVSAHDN